MDDSGRLDNLADSVRALCSASSELEARFSSLAASAEEVRLEQRLES